MAPLTPTYEYRDDQVFAVFENRVIASGTDFAKVAATAEEYFNSLDSERKHTEKEAARKTATHIETPNGLKGQIISRVEGLWGDEVTVRFENNQIRRFATTASDDLKYTIKEADAPSNQREALQTMLDEAVIPSRAGLTSRLQQLDTIALEAAQHIAAEFSPVEQAKLHQVVLAADAEKAEVKEALAYLDDVDAENAAPAAPVYAAVEQAEMGRAGADSWLDVTAREMIAESEKEDLDKLLEEEPTKLVSSLDDAAVHNAATVRDIAMAHVIAKTAGFTGDQVNAYRENFVANTESARRRELTYRQENTRQETIVKEAATDAAPDESLFL